MEIKGKIVKILPEESGQSSKGGWRKQQYIIEIPGQFPKKVCFMAWGDKIDDFQIRLNDELEVSIDIESREFNGRWYTDVKAWKVAKLTGTDDAPLPDEPPAFGEVDDSMEDLPF